jgi:hypothetical protein
MEKEMGMDFYLFEESQRNREKIRKEIKTRTI